MFARSRSLDDIVDRAYDLLLVAVGRLLTGSAEHRATVFVE